MCTPSSSRRSSTKPSAKRATAQWGSAESSGLPRTCWLCVGTGRSRDEVDETRNSVAAKAFALNIPGEMWASHGVQHPLGHDFSGGQDLIPQVVDEQTVLSYTAQVPVSLLREAPLTGTPNDVINQAAVWRDHGLR